MSKRYTTNFLEDTNGNTGVAGQVLVTTASGVSWQDVENTGNNQTQGALFDSKIVLIDTPNGGLKAYRVITDEYGEWIQVGRFAANAMTNIKGTWSSVSGLSNGITQAETTEFSADFGDSFPTEVRVVGATDFSNWRNTRTIDWVYKVPEGRKWKYFFSGGAANGMTTVPLVGGGSSRYGWTVNGAYDGFGRWTNADLVNIGMSDANVTNPSAAYSAATANAFYWQGAQDAKLSVNAYTTYSGQDQGTTSAVGNDDSINMFFDTYPTQTNNTSPGGTGFSSAVWILIKLPGGASGSGGGNYWAASGNDIYNTNSANVGIGTTSPGAKLQIGDYSTSGGNTLAILNSSGNQVLRLADYSAYYGFDIVNDDAGYLHIIRHANSVAGTSALTIKRDTGDIGIGTTAPLNLLHVSQASANTIFRLGNNASYDQFIYFNGGNDWSLGMDYSNSNAFVLSNASSIGTNDRIVVTTGGNVGIGTTDPSVGGTVGSKFTIIQADNSTGIAIYNGTSRRFALNPIANGGFTFFDGGGGGFNAGITQLNGNVGIGTDSPGAKLQVVGANTVEGQLYVGNTDVTYSAGVNFTTSGAIRGFVGWRHTNSGAPFNLTGIHLFNTDNSNIVFGTNNLVRAVIDTNGNVGIGITSPANKLSIGSTQDGGIDFLYDSTNNYKNQIKNYWNSSTDTRMDFNIGNSSGVTPVTIMSVGYAGHVGIGTTAPSSILQLGAGPTIATNSAYKSFQAGGFGVLFRDAHDAYITFNTTYSPSPAYWTNKYDGIKSGIIQITDGRFSIDLGTGTVGGATSGLSEKFVILNNGNVGIGTAAPLGTLDIGKSNATPSLVIGNLAYLSSYNSVWGLQSGAQSIMIFGNNGQNEIRAGSTNAGGYLDFYTNNTAAFTAASNGNFVMRLAANGNVGIGTTNPSFPLHVVGYARANGFSVNDSSGTPSAFIGYEKNWIGSGTSATLAIAAESQKINFYAGGTTNVRMMVSSSGAVGIGTTSPDRNLHIYQGDSGVTGYPLTGGIDIESTSITGINILSPNAGYGRIYFGAPISSTVGAVEYIHNATLASGYMKLRAGNVDTVFILGDGNVGIGTASPGYLLDVSKAVVGGTTDMRVFNSATTDAASGTRGIISVANAAVGDPRLVLAITGVKEYSLGIDNSDSDKFKINNGSEPSSGTNYLTIDSGNIGIGTTAPLGGKLHVYNSTGIFEGPSSGASVINSNTFGIQVGPTHDRISTANTYYPGIAFNHLLNLNGYTTYNVAPQGWIGLRLVDTPGSERSSLVFATKQGTGTSNTGTDIPTERMCITPFGNIGIGTTNPAYALDVTGTIRATGDVIAYSDARVKENIVTLENSLELVQKLRGVSYNKIGESEKKVGVIAQEVLEVLPEVVQQDQDGRYSVAYGNITAVLIEAIKQQQLQIDELKLEIKQLKG